jgi:hypothetical protein
MTNETTALAVRPARPDGPVQKALALFGVVPWSDEQPAKTTIGEWLRRVRAFRKAAPEALLPLERPAALRVLDRQIAALEGGSLGFQRIPLTKLREVLGWRNTDGMPTLAPFSVEHDTFEFVVSNWYNHRITPALPVPLRDCYDDVMTRLRNRSQARNVAVHATARFDGAIPDDVRRVIIASRSQFQDIRVLAEVEAWKIEETELPALRTDPLVIGYDGEEFWLLAAFDLTPLEEAVRRVCLGNEPTVS